KPPVASAPRCMRCQSSTIPSRAEYWHIGATHARLGKVVPRSVRGSKRRVMPCRTSTSARTFPTCPSPARSAEERGGLDRGLHDPVGEQPADEDPQPARHHGGVPRGARRHLRHVTPPSRWW